MIIASYIPNLSLCQMVFEKSVIHFFVWLISVVIAIIESSNLDKEQELKSKDERIIHLEKIMKEKSLTIASLRSDIESIQVS